MDDLFAGGLVTADLPADQAFEEAARIRQVLGAIEKLPGKEREALLLSAMDELSSAEIGVFLGRSESSVRLLFFRARTTCASAWKIERRFEQVGGFRISSRLQRMLKNSRICFSEGAGGFSPLNKADGFKEL